MFSSEPYFGRWGGYKVLCEMDHIALYDGGNSHEQHTRDQGCQYQLKIGEKRFGFEQERFQNQPKAEAPSLFIRKLCVRVTAYIGRKKMPKKLIEQGYAHYPFFTHHYINVIQSVQNSRPYPVYFNEN